MAKYASQTTVQAHKSRTDIERLLTQYGATSFAYMNRPGLAMIGFEIAGRAVRIDLPLPVDPKRTLKQQEQDVRRRWRSLCLVIKAKLVAVDDGISTIEREFLADLVMPNGQTLAQVLQPRLASQKDRVSLLAEYTGDGSGRVVDVR